MISLILTGCMDAKRQNMSKPDNDDNWVFLFDGRDADAWRGFQQDSLPEGWVVRDENLVALGYGGDLGGDIITREQFEDFELSLEWSISTGGNSGIFFPVLETDYPTV